MGQKTILSIFTETGSVEDTKADEDIQYATLPQEFFAWLLSNYQMAYDEVMGKWVQTVSFRNKKPIQVFEEWPNISDAPIDNIATDKFDEASALRDETTHKDSTQMWWAILAVILAFILTLILIFKLT